MNKSTFLVVFLCSYMSCFAQDSITKYVLESRRYVWDINRNRSEENKVYFNPKTVNYYFYDFITNYTAAPETPITQQWLARLQSDDNSLEVGFASSSQKERNYEYLKNLKYIGIKVVSEKQGSFFPLLDTDGKEASFGIDGRWTFFLNKKRNITPYRSKRDSLPEYRRYRLERKVREKLVEETNPGNVKVKNAIHSTMVEYSKKQDIVKAARIFFVNVNAFVSVNRFDYDIVTDQSGFNSQDIDEKKFRSWSLGCSLNWLQKYSWYSHLFSVVGNIYNNNNILTQEISEKEFAQISQNDTTEFDPIETKKIVVGIFDAFPTIQAKTEYTMLVKQTVGFSAALEQNWAIQNDFNRFNWKLGIPFSFKDKDGKNTVNFELQYRSVNKKEFLGIRVGTSFGSFVN